MFNLTFNKKIVLNKISLVGALFLIIILMPSWDDSDPSKKGKKIPEYTQRSGDPAKGKSYLLNGDYVSSGIPYSIYKTFNQGQNENLLNREGDNANVPPQFNVVKIEDGTKIIAPNCLTCHSDYINGEFIVGLGNTTFDFTQNLAAVTPFMSMAILNKFGEDSKEWRAYEPFKKASEKSIRPITGFS